MPSDPARATIKVAFASSDHRRVNQHFGAARAFAVFAVGAESKAMLEVVDFLETTPAENEGRLAAKIALLESCAAVYCQEIGASAIRRLLASGIQPVKVPAGTPIDELVAQLQEAWRAGPTGWLAKAVRKDSGDSRFATMAAEGWQE